MNNTCFSLALFPVPSLLLKKHIKVWIDITVLFTDLTIHHSTGKEDYQELKDCLGQTFDEIDEVKRTGIEIDGEHFDVEWWVFIMTLLFTYYYNLIIHPIKNKILPGKSMWKWGVIIIIYGWGQEMSFKFATLNLVSR